MITDTRDERRCRCLPTCPCKTCKCPGDAHAARTQTTTIATNAWNTTMTTAPTSHPDGTITSTSDFTPPETDSEDSGDQTRPTIQPHMTFTLRPCACPGGACLFPAQPGSQLCELCNTTTGACHCPPACPCQRCQCPYICYARTIGPTLLCPNCHNGSEPCLCTNREVPHARIHRNNPTMLPTRPYTDVRTTTHVPTKREHLASIATTIRISKTTTYHRPKPNTTTERTKPTQHSRTHPNLEHNATTSSRGLMKNRRAAHPTVHIHEQSTQPNNKYLALRGGPNTAKSITWEPHATIADLHEAFKAEYGQFALTWRTYHQGHPTSLDALLDEYPLGDTINITYTTRGGVKGDDLERA